MMENKQYCVLIVDDDATMRLLMSHTLKKADFQVEQVENGPSALEFFKRQIPDIILLDVMMPEMDGFTVCQTIRGLPGGEHIPILLVTGLDDIDSINQAYEAGATDFITKPITFPLLPHRVRYVLRASQAIENIGKSEARLAHAQAIAHMGNWEWVPSKEKMHWSDEIYRIFALDKITQHASADTYYTLVHPEDLEEVKQTIEGALKNRACFNMDHRIILGDEQIRSVHIQGEFGMVDGQPWLNGTLQDVTERKRTENELQLYRQHLEELVEQRTAELTETNVQLVEANKEAEQANALKDKFVSLVAHDLRSPLAGILSALEYIHTDEETPLNQEHQKIVGRLLEIGKSLVQMIGDVLNIGRLKSGKMSIQREYINLNDCIEQVIANLSYLAQQKGVNLHNKVPTDWFLCVDSTLYGEVVQNLTSNGIKFCNKGEEIHFFCPEKYPRTLAVRDNGMGIEPEKIQKLFNIEEKTSTPGTAGEQGTGFGLPFSQDIIQAHGGKLWVESIKGEGSTFYIQLPEESHQEHNCVSTEQ